MGQEQIKSIIYCRVSSERQVNEGHGLDSQELRCKQYAESNGYNVVEIFRDEGVSGGLFERPAMKSLIAYLDKNISQNYVIIFDDLSRFARDVHVHLKLKTELISRGATLKCPNYNFDDSPEGEFVELILAGSKQLERQQNKRQVTQKMKARMELGYWSFCPPTGYKFIKSPEHGKLIIAIEPEASILKEALEGYANNKFIDQKDIQDFLKTKNIKTANQKGVVHLTFVKRILTDPLYAGYIEYPKWEISRRKGHHEGIISIETFDRIQAKLMSNKKNYKARETDREDFPLRRLVKCACCNKIMTASNVKGKTKLHSLYTCNNKECTATPKNHKKLVIESKFTDMLKSISPEKEILSLMRDITLDVWDKSIHGYEESKKLKYTQIDNNKKEIDKILDLITQSKSIIVIKKYEERIESLEKENNQLRKITQLKNEPNYEEALDIVLDFIGTPLKYWESSDIKGKNLIHKLIFNDIPAYDSINGFGTPDLSLPFKIKECLAIKNIGMVEMRRIELRSKE